MPIRDRTKRRLPRLGIIRLGYLEERTRDDGSKYTFPKQSDHFELRDAPKIAKYFADLGITKPRALDVILPFPTLHENYDANYQVWASGVLLCKGDGERVQYAGPMRVTEDDKGTHVYNVAGATLVADGVAQCDFVWGEEQFAAGQIISCPGSDELGTRHPHCGACRMSAILKITPYADALFEFGYYQITTGSWRNHMTIMGTLQALPPVVLERKLPFTLRMVKEQTVYRDKTEQRRTTDRWFLHLMPHPDLLKALLARDMQALLAGDPAPERKAITATVDYEAEPVAPPPYAELGAVQEGEIVMDDEGEPPVQEPAPAEERAAEAEEVKAEAPSGRPYDPETLKQRVLVTAGRKRHRAGPSEKMSTELLGLAGQLWEEPELDLARVVGYLFDKPVASLTGKDVAALLDWLRAPGIEQVLVDQRAVSEAAQVIKLVAEAERQQALPGMEE